MSSEDIQQDARTLANLSDVFTSYYVDGASMYSAAPATNVGVESPYNFMSFLATAQRQEIDFLPITWEPLLDRVGFGGTAEISQSFLNLRLSYVFKRIRRDIRYSGDECNAFRALVSEILILGHPEIRGHPNIIRLVGICWEIDSGLEPVWPVLAFQKSQYGDLGNFIASASGKEIDFKARLKLCTDIAAAIVLMHSHGIVHGDIKPQNVLVFAETDGNYTAKVGDFGYSTLTASQSNGGKIHLPISTPWNAPEVLSWHTLFSVYEARLVDVYSFGLLCLWLLFNETLMKNNVHIEELKINVELETFTRDRLEDTMDLSVEQKRGLSSFFRSTLANDPSCRNVDLQGIMQSFARFDVPALPNSGFSTYEMYIPYLKWIPHHKGFDPAAAQVNHYKKYNPYSDIMSSYNPYAAFDKVESEPSSNFQVAKSFTQLMKADYRLWKYIFQCLEDQASHPASRCSREHGAFQLAFCCKVGFGTLKDSDKAMQWLERSKKARKDFESEIDLVKTDQHPLNFKNLETEISVIDYISYYQRSGVLADAQKTYITTALDVETTFGKSHPASIYLNHLLGLIFLARGDVEQAYGKLTKNAQVCEEWLGQDHPSTLASLATVASVYKRQGRIKEAEELEAKILGVRRRRLKAEDPTMIHSMVQLVSTYRDQERWKEAEELEVQIVDARAKTLGTKHPETLVAMANLLSNYVNQRRWKDAEELGVRSVEISKTILGIVHIETLVNMEHLAKAYNEQKKLEEAAELYVEIMHEAKKAFGADNTHTLDAMYYLAFIRKKQNRDTEAIDLIRETKRIQAEVLGPSDPATELSARALQIFQTLAEKT